MPKKFLLIFSKILLVFFAGCGFHLISPKQKTVYVEYFSNLSLQPQIEQYLQKNLKKTIAESPGLMIVSKKQDADLVIKGRIQAFSRNPEFISDSDQIIMASYKVVLDVEIEKDGKIDKHRFDQTYFMELSTKLKTDILLDTITKKVSQDIYLYLIQQDEK